MMSNFYKNHLTLGPMVYGIAYFPLSLSKDMKKMAFAGEVLILVFFSDLVLTTARSNRLETTD